MIKIKICGITNKEDAMLAQDLGADFLGFILYEKSQRYISLEDALHIKSHLKIPAVAVVVKKSKKEIEKLLEHFDFVQLHSDEPCEYAISYRLIKVYRVSNELPNIESCWNNNLILFDTFGDKYGGTGKTFDWNMLKALKRNFFVSGGLNEENVKSLLSTIKPYGVDVASGVEKYPGKKDPKKLEAFVKMVKS